MNVNGLNKVNTMNIANTYKGVDTGTTKQDNARIKPFDTIEYTSKKDGVTYKAIKKTLNIGGKEIEGVFVAPKDAKPNADGKIIGEFMKMEAFLEKMANELPTVNANQVKSYLPNIHTVNNDVNDFELFMEHGIKLSDGSLLLSPVMMNTGKTELKANDDGTYTETFTSFVGGHAHEPSISTYTEEELLKNKGLCSGSVKDLGNGKYEVTYFTDHKWNNYEQTTEIMTKEEVAQFIKDKHCRVYEQK